MSYEIKFARRAERYLQRLDSQTRERLVIRIDQIASDPFNAQFSKALKNAFGVRSARVGDYRIIFDVDDAARSVRIAAIGPRGQIYREL